MTETGPSHFHFLAAIQDFRRARRRAALQDLSAYLTGRSTDLLSYEDVRQKLKVEGTTVLGVQEIPLEAIVGSVGRYADFNRSFLPRYESDEERWASLKVKVASQGILSPIKVYQIGQAYFVCDGNHRVSIARELGATHIMAHVTEVHTKVPLAPQDSPDDLILKAEYADFLERTRLDVLRPQADLWVTVPGQYEAIEEHIAVQRHFLEREQGREIPCEEAATYWYDEVYQPMVRVIQERGLLRDFPGRTETDLYVWVAENRAALEEQLGWQIRPHEAAEHLVERASPKPQHFWARVGDRIREAVTPPELQAGPPIGHWREKHVAVRHDDRLFGDILVAINGQDEGWWALQGAAEVARREDARLHGLHVVPSEEERESEWARALQVEFWRRCQAAGVPGKLAVEVGVVSRVISQRARWVDLVVVSLAYPPAPQPVARLSSGLSALLRASPRPVLTVPNAEPHLGRALLAYDGSPKAQEALFVATYVAGRWGLPLVVVTVAERDRTTTRTLSRAERYLEEHDVEALLVRDRGAVADALLRTVEVQSSDLIIMGGYGYRPVLEVVLGSAVDKVLRASRRPVLICR